MSFGRAPWICGVIIAVQVSLYVSLLAYRDRDPPEKWWLAVPLVILPAAFIFVRRALRATQGRAFLVILLFLGIGLPVELGVSALLEWKLIASFLNPTGALSPTLLGQHAEMTCPSCGRSIAIGNPYRAPHLPSLPGSTRCTNCGFNLTVPENAPSRNGDKIIVDRTTLPERWEIGSFYFPRDPSVLYVKRLVGLPGESIEIFDGEVFIDGRLSRKPSSLCDDLWFPVQDTAFQPKSPSEEERGWAPARPGSPWRDLKPGWSFEGMERDEERLELHGSITDDFEYNAFIPLPVGSAKLVRDIRLDCTLAAFGGGGGLGFEWEQARQRVAASIAASGKVTLAAGDASASGQLRSPLSAPALVVFIIRDGMARVMVSGQPIVELEFGPQDLNGRKSESLSLSTPCKLSIIARSSSVTLSRIAVRRDVYYRSEMGGDSFNPLTLGSGQFYFLGDNSRSSFDSRYWGSVPVAHLHGTVRWIFWPPSRMRALP